MARFLDQELENPFIINSADIVTWFGVSDKTACEGLKQWMDSGLINPIIQGQRVRSYCLTDDWINSCFQNNGSDF